ncbi:MAG: VOC family protein [Chloroflexi bacterium]|nr:VOC family protein [Chloroflexota bacterium]
MAFDAPGTVLTEINVVVKNLDQAVEDYRKMGFRELHRGGSTISPVQSRYANLSFGGNVLLTIMESTEPGSPIDRFIQKRGEGLFSISFKVPDLDKLTNELKDMGAKLVLEEPLQMENGTVFAEKYKGLRANYVRPAGPTHGVVFELDELQQ